MKKINYQPVVAFFAVVAVALALGNSRQLLINAQFTPATSTSCAGAGGVLQSSPVCPSGTVDAASVGNGDWSIGGKTCCLLPKNSNATLPTATSTPTTPSPRGESCVKRVRILDTGFCQPQCGFTLDTRITRDPETGQSLVTTTARSLASTSIVVDFRDGAGLTLDPYGRRSIIPVASRGTASFSYVDNGDYQVTTNCRSPVSGDTDTCTKKVLISCQPGKCETPQLDVTTEIDKCYPCLGF